MPIFAQMLQYHLQLHSERAHIEKIWLTFGECSWLFAWRDAISASRLSAATLSPMKPEPMDPDASNAFDPCPLLARPVAGPWRQKPKRAWDKLYDCHMLASLWLYEVLDLIGWRCQQHPPMTHQLSWEELSAHWLLKVTTSSRTELFLWPKAKPGPHSAKKAPNLHTPYDHVGEKKLFHQSNHSWRRANLIVIAFYPGYHLLEEGQRFDVLKALLVGVLFYNVCTLLASRLNADRHCMHFFWGCPIWRF